VAAGDKTTLELNPNPTFVGMLHPPPSGVPECAGQEKEAFEETLLGKAAYGASPAEIKVFRKNLRRIR
jgi:hypothetical protein